MKKTAISILTCICVMVGMLSFSFPVNAASDIYVGGDVIYDVTNRSTGSRIGSLTSVLKNDGSYSDPTTDYVTDTSSSGSLLDTRGNIVYYLSDSIPPNTHVAVTFGIRVWVIPQEASLSFYKMEMNPSNPSTYYQWSCQAYDKNGSYDREFFYRVVFDNDTNITSIRFNNILTWLNTGINTSYTPYIYLMDCRVSYSFIDDNPNSDVLKDIRNNTSNTTDAVNNQTTTITNNIQNQTDTMTNGYDNSSMSDDNTRLNDQIAQYDQAQDSATNTSVSNIDAAEFINPSSNTSVFAAMTFSASFLQSLYNNLGDFGIVVMVSLSLCLGLMLVGWFKYRKGG